MSQLVNLEQLVKLIKNINNTVVFIGPTAAGKDTLMNEVARRSGIEPIISHTTRPMRPNEIDGREYYFVSDEVFESIPMVERRTYQVANGNIWKYGLSVAAANRQGILILDLQGYFDFYDWAAANNQPSPVLVYLPVNYATAKARQEARGDFDEDEFNRRWESDLDWLGRAALAANYIYTEEDTHD